MQLRYCLPKGKDMQQKWLTDEANHDDSSKSSYLWALSWNVNNHISNASVEKGLPHRKAFTAQIRESARQQQVKTLTYMRGRFNNVKFKRLMQQTREQSLRLMYDKGNATAAILWQVTAAGNWQRTSHPTHKRGGEMQVVKAITSVL